jgi:hypothetical protein
LTLSFEEIDQLSNRMERESKAIKDEIYRLCWYMRGSLSFTDAYNLSIEDIDIIGKIVKDNLETTKKTQMPFF